MPPWASLKRSIWWAKTTQKKLFEKGIPLPGRTDGEKDAVWTEQTTEYTDYNDE